MDTASVDGRKQLEAFESSHRRTAPL
jgi:hypothetical protein